MKKPKPQVAVVFGILHLVFGGLSVVCNVCQGALVGGMYALVSNLYPKLTPPEQRELDELWRSLNDNVPGLVVFTIVDLVGSMVLGLILLVAGIGLLGVKSWARSLSIGWAIIRIVFLVGLLVYNVAYVNPGKQKFM